MRPFNQSGPASQLNQQQQQQQNQPPNLGPLNANNNGFGGHTQCFTNATGVFEEYMVKSIVCEGRNFGKPEQNFSSEMLRWDDYRQAKQISDGTPSMKTIYDTNEEGMMQGGLPFVGHRETLQKATSIGVEKLNHLYKVFVAHPQISGEPEQNFCSEMDRWDHMRATKQINDNTPNMCQTFSRKDVLTSSNTDADHLKSIVAAQAATGFSRSGVFEGYKTEVVDSAGIRSYCTYKVMSCKPVYEGRSTHNLCSEMLRWDSYRTDKKIDDGIGSLQQMFDIPLTASALDTRLGNNQGGQGNSNNPMNRGYQGNVGGGGFNR